jgi:DNA-binding LytR/AlgR family response regulator
MNVVIVEDEHLAAERLHQLIRECEPGAVVVARFEGIDDTVQFFRGGNMVDLIMLDIQLADGKAFELLEKINLDIPIIFTTAFDNFALQAFKHHSIDYLLKPIQPEALKASLDKFRRISENRALKADEISSLKTLLAKANKNFRERIIIKSGNKLYFKQCSDVALFIAEGKSNYLQARSDTRKFLIDHTLEELESVLDPDMFYRISRKFIVNIDSIAEIKGLVSNKLEIRLNQPCDYDLLVSRERAHAFKKWLNR